MRSHFALLRFVARAAGNAVGFGVAGDFAVDFLPDLAQDVWAWWKGTTSEEQRKAEIEALSQTGTEEMLKEAGEIVQAELADKTPETRQAVATYLAQVPNSIRRSLRRPSDPTGMTMPGGLQLRKAEDLLQLLPSKPPRFKPGDRPLHGVDWELEQLLGVGGFGEVWKARNPHMTSAPPVALKFCLDAAAAKMLRNEASVLDRVMSQGKHSGIVQLRQTYLSADTPCLEYEYVAGGDLLGLVHDMQQPAGKLGWKQATQIIGRLAEIVGFAHRLSRPIVHRDLKPANILVYLKDGKAHLKIADFGIGAVAASQAIQKTLREASHGASMMRTLLGSYTPLYASPQQKRGEPPDPRDDVFALGVIWYQLLRGNMVAGPPSGMGWQKRLSEQACRAKSSSCYHGPSRKRRRIALRMRRCLQKHFRTS